MNEELQKNESLSVQYEIVEVDKSSVCQSEMKYTFFPDQFQYDEGTELCTRFGGRRVDVSTKDKFDNVVQFMGGIREDPAFTKDMWITTHTLYTDKDEFNVWRNRETGELPEFDFKWGYAEPNGGMIENCAEVRILEMKNEDGQWVGYFNDMTCTSPIRQTCQDIGEVTLTLRG